MAHVKWGHRGREGDVPTLRGLSNTEWMTRAEGRTRKLLLLLVWSESGPGWGYGRIRLGIVMMDHSSNLSFLKLLVKFGLEEGTKCINHCGIYRTTLHWFICITWKLDGVGPVDPPPTSSTTL